MLKRLTLLCLALAFLAIGLTGPVGRLETAF